ESNSNVYLSSRNLQKVKVVTTEELNVFDLINASQIVFLEGSLATVQENLTK
ncbi:MAG TPA: 50S ribosomal protein L4, partial [Flavobacteriaceae bacterium]|nr:50S ribosomal protein L4 [Flavobacteriaceae bacterium]